MERSEYYGQMKELAQQIRSEFGLNTPRVLRTDLRNIYQKYEIKIDLWPAIGEKLSKKFRNLRGAYFNDEIGATVMINRHLPEDPRIFTMAHELKHHLVDKHNSLSYCGQNNESVLIEIGAEVFAAELIYPDMDFFNDLKQMGVKQGSCRDSDLVRLKHQTRTTLSYAGLAKRAIFFKFAVQGAFDKTQWKKIEMQIYGPPAYKRVR